MQGQKHFAERKGHVLTFKSFSSSNLKVQDRRLSTDRDALMMVARSSWPAQKEMCMLIAHRFSLLMISQFLGSCILEVLFHSFSPRTPERLDFFLRQRWLTPHHHYKKETKKQVPYKIPRVHKSSIILLTHHSYNIISRLNMAQRERQRQRQRAAGVHPNQTSWTTWSLRMTKGEWIFLPDSAVNGFDDHPAIKEPMIIVLRSLKKPPKQQFNATAIQQTPTDFSQRYLALVANR